ncbi:hypothetical protein SLEP1_g17388 [Rubroshorea leprosula]|uniref:Pentatricopeptide repeat-containing protein n=1 Tax=Rubroshorea leprosula TaxID=152421 RepID=A0AAV5IZY6_9ROSI|nr:hypothetical protein SLEP1_g17388 [Rubroshorea leprosula]
MNKGNSGLVDKAVELYHFMVKIQNCGPNVFACNSLLNALVKCWRVNVARKLFDEMIKRDSSDNYSVCIMMRGLCRAAKVEEDKKLIEDRWGEGCVPNILFYYTLIDGYSKKGYTENATKLFKEHKMKGFLLTLETEGAMINGFCKKGILRQFDKLLLEMRHRGLGVNVEVILISLMLDISMVLKDGKDQEADQLLEEAIRRGDFLLLKVLLAEMLNKNVQPDAYVCATLVEGFVRNGDLEEAKKFFQVMIEEGMDPGNVGYNAMIFCKFDGYVKQHNINGALIMLGQMVKRKCQPNVTSGLEPNVVTYAMLIGSFCKLMVSDGWSQTAAACNSIVICLCQTGTVKVAFQLQEKMMSKGFILDPVSFAALLHGVCLEGRSKAWRNIFSNNFNEQELQTALKYLEIINKYLHQGVICKASIILQSLIDYCRLLNQKENNLKVSAK